VHLFLLMFRVGKFCTSLLETLAIRFPFPKFKDIPLCAVGSELKICPSARCTSSANAMVKDVHIPFEDEACLSVI
jgi:hypothetical protein